MTTCSYMVQNLHEPGSSPKHHQQHDYLFKQSLHKPGSPLTIIWMLDYLLHCWQDWHTQHISNAILLNTYLKTCPFARWCICPSVIRFVRGEVHLWEHLSVLESICSSFCAKVVPPVLGSVCPSVGSKVYRLFMEFEQWWSSVRGLVCPSALKSNPAILWSVCQSVRPQIRPSVNPSFRRSIRPWTHPSVDLPSVCRSLCPWTHPSVDPSIHRYHLSVDSSVLRFIRP